MLQGMYAAASGMQADILHMDVISNNIANMDTPGYKKGILTYKSFSDTLSQQIEQNAVPGSRSGMVADEIVTDFSQGDSLYTGSPLDCYLGSEGFFTVETSQGLAYTRCGSFAIDADGFLVTQEGLRVLGDNGPINLGAFHTIDIADNGTVLGDGMPVGSLLITAFPKPYRMSRVSGGLFIPDMTGGEEKVLSPGIKQFYVESSNVGSVGIMNEMVSMIRVNRHFEANQRVVGMYDQILGRAATELARL